MGVRAIRSDDDSLGAGRRCAPVRGDNGTMVMVVKWMLMAASRRGRARP